MGSVFSYDCVIWGLVFSYDSTVTIHITNMKGTNVRAKNLVYNQAYKVQPAGTKSDFPLPSQITWMTAQYLNLDIEIP
jgi:hypothetical protein